MTASMLGRVGLLVLLGAGTLWWLTGRVTRDPAMRRIVLASYSLRVALALALFAISWWHLPILEMLQASKKGFWLFAVDANVYDYYGAQMASAWAAGTELPDPEGLGIEYFTLVGAVYRLLGRHPLYPIIFNCWFAALTGLLAYMIIRRRVDQRTARMGGLWVSFWPSTLLWSSQLLKDSVALCLLFAVLYLVMNAASTVGQPHPQGRMRTVVRYLLIGLFVVLATRLRFYLGSGVALASLLVFFPLGVVAFLRRQKRSGFGYVGLSLIVAGSVLFARSLDTRALLSPRHPDQAHHERGLRYWRQGELAYAEEEFFRAIQLNRRHRPAYLSLATLLVQRGEFNLASQIYTSYLELEDPPQRQMIRQLIARLLIEHIAQNYREGRWAEAAAAYEQAIRFDPSSAAAHANLGLALAQEGKLTMALAMLEKALAFSEPGPPREAISRQLAHTYLAQGEQSLLDGQVAHATTAYEQAIRFDPSSAAAHANLGLALAATLPQTSPSSPPPLEPLPDAPSPSALPEPPVASLPTTSDVPSMPLPPEVPLTVLADASSAALPQTSPSSPPPLEPLPDGPSHGTLPEPPVASLPTTSAAPSMPPLLQPPLKVRAEPFPSSLNKDEIVATSLAVLSSQSASGAPHVDHVDWQTDGTPPWFVQNLAQLDEQAVSVMSETHPEFLQERRAGFVSSGGYSLIDPWAMISSPRTLLSYLPRALLVGYLAPFPWQWFDTHGSTGVMRTLAGVEMLCIYLLLPGMIVGCGRMLMSRHPDQLFLIVYIGLMSVAISLVVANVGTLFRLRLQFLMPLPLVAVVGRPLELYGRLATQIGQLWRTRFPRHERGKMSERYDPVEVRR